MHTCSGWTLSCGHTPTISLWNWRPRHSDGRELIEESGICGSTRFFLGKTLVRYKGPHPAARMDVEGPTVGLPQPLAHMGVSLRWAVKPRMSWNNVASPPSLLLSPLFPPCPYEVTPWERVLRQALTLTKLGPSSPGYAGRQNAKGDSSHQLLQHKSLHESLWLNPSKQPEW